MLRVAALTNTGGSTTPLPSTSTPPRVQDATELVLRSWRLGLVSDSELHRWDSDLETSWVNEREPRDIALCVLDRLLVEKEGS